jgi:hypothetical protein
LRAGCESDTESKLSLETDQLWQGARDERGKRETEREREECSARLRVQCLRVERDKQRGFMANVNEDFLKDVSVFLILFPIAAFLMTAFTLKVAFYIRYRKF